MERLCGAFAGLVLLAGAAAGARADSLDVGVGVFDAWDRGAEGRIAAVRVEYRWDRDLVAALRPLAGLMGNADGGFYAYGGVYLPLALGDRWTLLPNLSLGVYEAGEGRDLGGELEFQPGLDLYYRLTARSYAGLSVRHLSNARLYAENPGTETLMLRYGRRF